MTIPQLLAFFDTISAPPPPTFTANLTLLTEGYQTATSVVRDPEWTDEEFRDKQELATDLFWVSKPW